MIATTSTPTRCAAPAARRTPSRRSTAARALDIRNFAASAVVRFSPGLAEGISEIFGPELPADIQYNEEWVADPALRGMVFTCTYDEGFCGHFSVPGTDGAAARFEDVFDQPEVLSFLRDHLEFRPLNYQSPKGADADEIVIFAPGLNTLHKIKPGWYAETTTPQRLVHYSGVIQRPMVQMHLGTDMDQGEAPLRLSRISEAFLNKNRDELTAGGVMPRIADGHAYWDPRQRDRMESALGKVGVARPLLQTNIVKLLHRNETEKQPLVLFPYSRSTSEVCRALRLYIDQFVEDRKDAGASETAARREVEAYLREYVTVFSFGNVSRRWPDGPAYVHFSHISNRPDGGTDPLTQEQGVSINWQEGAGADAVFVHPDGLFSGFDAHNFGASGASNLRIIMLMNDCVTLRDVWEKAQKGPLKLPDYQETAAGVELCTGKQWLWEADRAWKGVQLMHPSVARQILGENW